MMPEARLYNPFLFLWEVIKVRLARWMQRPANDNTPAPAQPVPEARRMDQR